MAERRKHKRRPWPGAPGSPADRSSAAADAGTSGRRRRVRRVATPYLLALLSAILLTLAFPPMEVSWLAYIALVPLLVMAVRTRTTRTAFLAAGLGGLVFFGINMHWIRPVTWAGYAAMTPYLACYWAVFAWGLRRVHRTTNLPLTLVAPILWIPLEFLRAWMLTGLPWVLLGHTQYENLGLIQTADLFGAYGPGFLVMMTTGLAADFLTRPLFVTPRTTAAGGQGPVPGDAAAAPAPKPHLNRVLAMMVVLAAAAWTGTVWYGQWRLGQTERREGPVVSSIQTNVPQEVKLAARHKQIEELELEMLNEQLDLTRLSLAEARAHHLKPDLIVWPETMVPGIQNAEFLNDDLSVRLKDADQALRMGLTDYQGRSQVYWKAVREMARDAGAAVLFGAHSVMIEGVYRMPNGYQWTRGPRYNTALLVLPDSTPYAAEHVYWKAHLVPFGEYLPFKESWPWLHARLQGFTPYDFDYSLTPGPHDQKPFTLKYDGGEARFQVPICYEDALPYRVREMVRPAAPGEGKAVDFLVNISNDGWFNGSIELDQHLNLCVFRAVENRVPIVRSVNTGISAIITSDGRIDRVVEKDGERRRIKGRIVGRLMLDGRLAPYTCIGDVFAWACVAATALLAAATFLAPRVKRGKESDA